MPHTPTVTSLPQLAGMVRDGDRIGVGGLHFSRVPLTLIGHLCHLRRRELHFISWGGGLALEMLLAAGAVRKISFCFSSLDVFGLAPQFRAAVESGQVEAEDWPALAMIQGFHAAQQRLASMPFQWPQGSQIFENAPHAKTYVDPFDRRTIGAAPALPLDAFLLHTARADEDGNVEIQGARGLDLCAAGAARNMLVTVERIVPRGTLATGPRAAIVPRTHVRAIAVCPSGAYPTSCLPDYAADFHAIHEATQQRPLTVPEASGDRVEFIRSAARVAATTTPSANALAPYRAVASDAPPTPDEQMVVNLARLYDNDSICAAGAVSPLAMVSYLLAKRLHAPKLLLMTMSSGFIDVAARPMLLTLAEALDFRSAVAHGGGEETYHSFYQGGYVTHEVVGSAQVDRLGRTNNVWLTSPGGKRIRLPGQGGMADVANMHQNFVVYVPRHSPQSMVNDVPFASAARGVIDPAERRRHGWQEGYVRVITNLAVFEQDLQSRELELIALNPGVTLDQVREATGFPVSARTGLTALAPPTSQELALIRSEIDPLAMRQIEFVAARDRTPLLDRIINSEEALIHQLLEDDR
jgi:glutaconate CoA-transferase subunit A